MLAFRIKVQGHLPPDTLVSECDLLQQPAVAYGTAAVTTCWRTYLPFWSVIDVLLVAGIIFFFIFSRPFAALVFGALVTVRLRGHVCGSSFQVVTSHDNAKDGCVARLVGLAVE